MVGVDEQRFEEKLKTFLQPLSRGSFGEQARFCRWSMLMIDKVPSGKAYSAKRVVFKICNDGALPLDR